MIKRFIIVIIFFSSCDSKDNLLIQEIKEWKLLYDDKWINATVPGNNFSDLLDNNIISNPFYGTYEDSVQWISEREWLYKGSFSVSQEFLNKKSIKLIFYGLDSYARVYLNDSLILKNKNMFVQSEVNVKALLKKENILKILFLSPEKIEQQKQQLLGYKLPGGSRVHTRKAAFNYGWDWSPKIISSGIWRKIELIGYSDSKLEKVYIEQVDIKDSIANLNVNIEISANDENQYDIYINEKKHKIQLKEGKQNIVIPYEIHNPKLWFPNGHGEQFLYEITASIKRSNRILDSKKCKIGLRTIDLVLDKDTHGKQFYFKVNDKPVFIKGANYIPQDNLQNRVDQENYKQLLTSVIDANMNMLRVWGGGIYEEDIFYDLCDSLGILVWQDFMFACAMYPSDDDFLTSVKEEAIYNVQRLSNHPSIALWCGNNENSEGWHRWGWQNEFTEIQKKEIWGGYKKVFQQILPEIVNSNSQTPYWETSPKFGRGNPQYQFQGDAHYWGIWHDAEPFENFNTTVPRFMSEFGFQSFPEFSTIAKISESSDWNIDSKTMQIHQKHPRGNALILEYMNREYNLPTKFKYFLYASQILQAEGMRIGLEAHLRNQPYCMGSLYWQLNDCWPAVSWSSIDYYGNWKALHYTAKDVFSPLILSLNKKEDNFIELWSISEVSEYIDTLVLKTFDLQGNELESIEEVKTILPGATLLIDRELKRFSEEIFMVGYLKQKDIQSKTLFFTKKKNLTFLKPEIKISWKQNSLIVTTKKPAFQVYLHGIEGNFSDNFFDLFPGEEKIVTIDKKGIQKNNLLIWSLYDLNKK